MAQNNRVEVVIAAVDQTKAAFARVEKDLSGLNSRATAVASSIKAAWVTVAAAVATLATGQIVATITEFERLNASLKTITGSSADAKAAMGFLRDFAATTPYQLQEVVTAFTRLSALGLTPSREAMESYGNTASAMGKNLIQMIEAVADASTGEFERLKEFGIKAKSEGDKVSFTFQGVTTTVGKNAREIEEYLIKIGQVQFAGAMADQMNTLGGKISNLKDEWDALVVTVGDTGLRDAMKGATESAIDSLKDISGWFKENRETVHDWVRSFRLGIMAVQAEIMRLSMLLDKVGGTMTFLASLPSAIPAAVGVKSSQERMQRMANYNIMYENRYAETERRLQELAQKYNEVEGSALAASTEPGPYAPKGKAGGGDSATEADKKAAAAAEKERLAETKRGLDAQADAMENVLSWTEELEAATLSKDDKAIRALEKERDLLLNKSHLLTLMGQQTEEEEAKRGAALNEMTQKEIDAVKNKTGALSEFQVQAFRSMEQAGADFFHSLRTGSDDWLKSFVDMVGRMVDEWAAAQAMMGLFGADYAKPGGSVGGLAGGIASSWNDSSSMLGGLNMWLSDVLPFADGGWVKEPVLGIGLRSGSAYSFAEQEPELIMNRAQVAGAFGGGGSSAPVVHQTIQIDARGAEPGTEQRLRAAVEEGARKGYQMALNDIRTRGPIYKGMRA